jgi:SAM-dependent methyltransferase
VISTSPNALSSHAAEVARGERFEFGANWARFLEHLDEPRIHEAESSLTGMLGVQSLSGKTFLDIGSGSGLFSLAAYRLGATVRSFDYDPKSVACTRELRRRFAAESNRWSIEEGSILDRTFLARLGKSDIVYSWGVLHHTGRMWEAMENAAGLVTRGGLIFIAIYNRQAVLSPFWSMTKRVYNRAPRPLRRALDVGFFSAFGIASLGYDVVRGRNPTARYTGHGQRGMHLYRDVVDWIGGWPFEVASPAEIVGFFQSRGFRAETVRTCGWKHGCNEFVFQRAR